MIIATVVAAIACLAGIPVLGAVAGLALVFVLPGSALLGLAGSRRRFSRIERIVLTPALGVAVCVLGGIVLDLAGVPLRTPAWALLTGGVTVVAALLGPPRRMRLPKPSANALVATALIVAMLVGAGWISARSAARQSASTAVTSLSLIPAGAGQVAIGVATGNAPAAAYRIVVTQPDGSVTTYRPDVGRSGRWDRDIAIAADGRITADLYRGSDPTPDRSVFLDAS